MCSKEEYIERCQQDWVPLFFQPYWWDTVLKNWDVQKFETENATAYLPYASYKKFGFSFSRNPFLTPYSGLLFAERNYPTAHKQELFDQAKVFLERFAMSQYDLNPNLSQGIKSDKTKPTFLLDTQKSLEEIQANFKPSLKRQLKKAEKLLTITEDNSYQTLYSIYQDSLSRQKSDEVVPEDIIQKVHELTSKKELGKIFLAQDEQSNTHAAIWYVADKHTAYYLLGGSAEKFLGSGAMGLLLQHCIKQAIKDNKQQFDFEGSAIPGVARFFAGFGGKKVEYPVLSAKTNPKLNALLKLKGMLKK